MWDLFSQMVANKTASPKNTGPNNFDFICRYIHIDQYQLTQSNNVLVISLSIMTICGNGPLLNYELQ